ncbi:hypothetical protein Tco_0223773 [Tanacetum coccineum]
MAAPGAGNQVARRVIDDLVDLSGETSVQGNLIARLNALIAEMEALEDQGEVYDTLMGLRDDRHCENTKLMGLNDLITQAEEIEMKEAQSMGMKLASTLLINLQVIFLRSVVEDYRLAMEINRVTMEVDNVVSERAEFIEELDSLGVRPVPAETAEVFGWSIQMKDQETMARLQILEREIKLNASNQELTSGGVVCLSTLDYMREIVARDTAKLGVLEQLLACTHVGIPLKAGYVADMEEKE